MSKCRCREDFPCAEEACVASGMYCRYCEENCQSVQVVERITEPNGGSHIEPPLEQSWSNLKKLRWHAMVLLADTTVEVNVRPVPHKPQLFFLCWWEGETRHTLAARDFRDTWNRVSDMSLGAEILLAQQKARTSPTE